MPRGIPKAKLKALQEAANARLAEAAEDRRTIQQLPVLPPPPPPAPEPPNPVVLALQEQILGLVTQRTSVMGDIQAANARLRIAEADFNSARERLQQMEGEVQYRLGLIAQMQGKPAMQGWSSPAAFPNTSPVTLHEVFQPPYADVQAKLAAERGPSPIPFSIQPHAGMGSIPAQRPPMAGVVGEVRSESAEDERRAM